MQKLRREVVSIAMAGAIMAAACTEEGTKNISELPNDVHAVVMSI